MKTCCFFCSSHWDSVGESDQWIASLGFMCSSTGFREQPADGSRQSEESLWIQDSLPCQASVSDHKSTSYIIQDVYFTMRCFIRFFIHFTERTARLMCEEQKTPIATENTTWPLHHLNLNNCLQMLYYTKLICKDDEPLWTICSLLSYGKWCTVLHIETFWHIFILKWNIIIIIKYGDDY